MARKTTTGGKSRRTSRKKKTAGAARPVRARATKRSRAATRTVTRSRRRKRAEPAAEVAETAVLARSGKKAGAPAPKPSGKAKGGKKKGKKGKKADHGKKGKISSRDLRALTSRDGLLQLLRRKKIKVEKALEVLRYEEELERLQIELVRLQRHVQITGRRVAIVFEGRDAAGKGGAIRRFMEHLNPRTARIVALPKPTEVEQGQWYFQRYTRTLPNPGEICFFDRSWYNRAVVEPVMNFCNKDQYARFMQQVPEFEHMLYEDGIELIKFWFSISKDEQAERFAARRENPLKQWKISPVDERAQEHWDLYTFYKQEMFSRTHTTFSPWTIVRANVKKKARLESIRHVLSTLEYEGKGQTDTILHPDPSIVRRFHRELLQDD